MEQLLHEMNPWWEEEFPVTGIPRQRYLSILEENLNNKDILLITGLRRVGKSTIMKQLIHKLITCGVSNKKICYISLDAYLFRNHSIFELVRVFRKIQNVSTKEKIYLFLDEVTAKDSFNQELKNLYDLGNIKIIASSSSATLLRDKKAYLTGRARTFEIEPLSYPEFLQFKNIRIAKADFHLHENYFAKYMELGGMPEYVLTGDPAYITNLIENILYKDIVAVHGIRQPEIVKDLFALLCERVGKRVSFNKLAHILGISKDTVKKYIQLFEEAYLFYIIEKDARSLNERVVDLKKIYCADVGIKNVTVGYRDLGAIFENLVFLKIKKEKPRYIKKDGIELDFSYGNVIIEAKYKRELIGKQKELFEKIKNKEKKVVQGVEFFLGR